MARPGDVLDADPRYFQFPMLRRILERSRGVIVHNPGAAAIAARCRARNEHCSHSALL